MDFNFNDLSADMIMAIWILLALRIVVWAFYANSVRKLLLEITETNRFLRPTQAWLLVIPFVNIYWNFVVARAISNSLNNEFYDRQISEEPHFGLSKGLSYAWMFLLSNIPFPSFILMTFFILSIIYFIQYWIKISNFRQLIVEHNLYFKKQDDETP